MRRNPFAFSLVFTRKYLIVIPFFMLVSLVTQSAYASLDEAQLQLRQTAQLVEYLGVDYVAAVENGQVVNPAEYQEMTEFSTLIVEKIRSSATSSALEQQAVALQQAVLNKRDVVSIRQLTSQLRHSLLAVMPQSSLPTHLLPLDATRTLFEAHCAVCHGATGQGNGPMAAQLEPMPTNFMDKERAENRSILGLYDAIANGIDDTAMPAFGQITEQQRWSLAFYAGSLAFQSAPQPSATEPAVSVQQMVNQNPAQLAANLPENKRSDIDALRANPALLFSAQPTSFTITRDRLTAAYEAHQQGNYSKANNLALSAYLDGFELAENSLNAHDVELRKSIEVQLMSLRQLLGGPQNQNELDRVMASALSQLAEAERLTTEASLSNGTLFTASLVILLREGLEALLVVIALMTVLMRTQRQDALKYVHLGWIGALLAGAATWVAARSLIDISGASREIMEGVAALLAALVLFYVGFWMHSKTHAAQWQAYIEQHVHTQLKSGAIWGLAGLSFIAVYREVFETVLFYESLLTQTVAAQQSFVIGGFLLAAVILAVLAWALIRYSIKLPIGKFFSSTTYLLVALSFVLMGKAIKALQEAAVIGITQFPISFEIEWLGIKSTWQGILAQGVIVLLFVAIVCWPKMKPRPAQDKPLPEINQK